MDNQHFEKISKATRSKEAWNIMENYHNDGEKAKQVMPQLYKRKYEMMQMVEDRKVSDCF
jgi:glutamate synthase domain-containing protein 3